MQQTLLHSELRLPECNKHFCCSPEWDKHFLHSEHSELCSPEWDKHCYVLSILSLVHRSETNTFTLWAFWACSPEWDKHFDILSILSFVHRSETNTFIHSELCSPEWGKHFFIRSLVHRGETNTFTFWAFWALFTGVRQTLLYILSFVHQSEANIFSFGAWFTGVRQALLHSEHSQICSPEWDKHFHILSILSFVHRSETNTFTFWALWALFTGVKQTFFSFWAFYWSAANSWIYWLSVTNLDHWNSWGFPATVLKRRGGFIVDVAVSTRNMWAMTNQTKNLVRPWNTVK